MRAAIIGISGQILTREEMDLLGELPPLGIILFGRNIADRVQLASLMASLRSVLLDDAVLLVDQEGGRVARLWPPEWSAHPSAATIGALLERDPAAGMRLAWLTGALIGLDCREAGFDVVCAPVLDRAVAGANAVIGDRAFAADPADIVRLAGAYADGLLQAGIQPVGKHVPGHGRALLDSHLALPELDRVDDADLASFAAMRWLPWWMTAHLLYRNDDPEHPATQSPHILQSIVRGRLGFDNLLVSDDLCMLALSGTAGERAATAVQAGCDVALHCSGVIAESRDVLRCVPGLTEAGQSRLRRAAALARERQRPLKRAALADERSRLL